MHNAMVCVTITPCLTQCCNVLTDHCNFIDKCNRNEGTSKGMSMEKTGGHQRMEGTGTPPSAEQTQKVHPQRSQKDSQPTMHRDGDTFTAGDTKAAHQQKQKFTAIINGLHFEQSDYDCR